MSLKASAYVELHAWLAGAARTDTDVDPELEPARRAYKRSLQDDEGDALLEQTTRALSTCTDDACAAGAVASAGFGYAYTRALPRFLAEHWKARATVAWGGVEAAHAALVGRSGSSEAILDRAARDLGVVWPDRPVRVDVVAEAPPPSRDALIPVLLGARGSCFFMPRNERKDDRVHDARVIDCVLVHALLGAHQPTELRVALDRALGNEAGERAWSVLVIHAVAATVTGWEPKHLSAYRRSAMSVEGAAFDWLAREWHGAPIDAADASTTWTDDFAARYAAQWRRVHHADGSLTRTDR